MGVRALSAASTAQPLTESQLVARLRQIGEERYHHRHPFHLLMHEGKLTRGQLQAWALNRYCYQSAIPIKDSIILSRSNDPEFRRAWRKRIVDHDGENGRPGGIEKWLRLAEATGLDRALVISGDGVLPGVKYAVDAYLRLVADRSFLEAVASSLTELFSGTLIALRLDALRWTVHACRVGIYPLYLDRRRHRQHRPPRPRLQVLIAGQASA